MGSLMTELKEAAATRTYRQSFETLKHAVRHHITGTHITRTYPSGTSGRLEATWDAGQRQFVCPGNDIWLRFKDGGWSISVRTHSGLGRDPCVEAMVAQANTHGKRGRLNQMWHIYWMLILMSHTQYDTQCEDIHFDLHIEPFLPGNYLSPAEMGMD